MICLHGSGEALASIIKPNNRYKIVIRESGVQSVKQVLWWLIAGSRGGINRARIILALHTRPYNANQLTRLCSLDYKTVRHHLEVLKKHHIITATGEDYGTMYFLSEQTAANFEDFLEISKQIDVPQGVREE